MWVPLKAFVSSKTIFQLVNTNSVALTLYPHPQNVYSGPTISTFSGVCVYLCVCVGVFVFVCVCVCVCVCVYAFACLYLFFFSFL